ncbi:6623_t:CDS:2, partial [Cetraspora pellucida]
STDNDQTYSIWADHRTNWNGQNDGHSIFIFLRKKRKNVKSTDNDQTYSIWADHRTNWNGQNDGHSIFIFLRKKRKNV